MKKLKKLTAVVMVCVLSLTAAVVMTKGKEDAYAAEVAMSGKAGVNAIWTVSEDGTATISGTGIVTQDIAYGIAEEDPTALQYYTVTLPTGEIEERSFIARSKSEKAKSVKKVSVQEGITGFEGETGFKFFNMKEAELADSITDIGWAFWGCSKLEKITLPNKLIEIEYQAFEGCSSLPEIMVPSSVSRIGEGAFSYCRSLKNVKLTNNVTTVAYETFYDCSSLPEVTVPYSVTSIEEKAFGKCSSLKTITFEGDAPEFGYNAFDGVTATVYYPLENSTWTVEKQQDYGGSLTWVPIDLAENLAIVSEGTDTDYATGSGKEVMIQSTGPLKYFTGISVDGALLDPSDYKLDTGLNAVIISAQYLDKLTAGEHVVTLNYTYGSVSTVLKVSSNSRTNIGTNPKTADSSHVIAWIIAGVLSAGGLCLSMAKRRKELDCR